MNDAIHSLSILIIEDDADTLANLRDILELDAHRVVGVSTLAEARRAASTETFAIAISDRKLPDGLIEDALPVFKDVLDGAEIIVITGYADMQSTITAFREGVSDYVIKPIIPDHLRSTVRRIAEQRRLESELAKEHAFAELVLSTAEAVVLVLDLDGKVTKINPYFERLTGWTIAELRGKCWFEYCTREEDRDRLREVFSKTLRGHRTSGIVNAVIGRDGRHHQIRWSNTTLADHDGNVTSMLSVGVDISDLAAAQERALRSERLATIGQTMTALAHESRNALQRIQAASEMLELDVEGNEAALGDLKSIQRASGDLRVLLEEVRSFAAPIQIRTSPSPLPTIWRRVWEDLSALRQNRDSDIVEHIEGCGLELDVDAQRMEQVFRNLFENALAACDDPVRIDLRCRSSEDAIRLTVSDNGPGMDRGQLQKAFQPFFTTKQTGTGLGLAICQRIIEAHGGSISAACEGDGAIFRITLPRTRPRGIAFTDDPRAIDSSR